MRPGVKYLTGVSNKETQQVARVRADLGLMIQPGNSLHRQIDRYPFFAVDSGCYGDKFDPERWRRTLDHAALWPDRCLFAVVPDRFDPADLPGNHPATLDLWPRWVAEVTDRGLPTAFVCQNGSTPDDVPQEAEAVFIGGDTAWKLSRWAWAQVAAGQARGRWAHVGRVNTAVRFGSARIFGADSADGTLVRHGPRPAMIGQLVAMLDQPPQLPLSGPAAGWGNTRGVVLERKESTCGLEA
jgi:hypothetical protein